MPDPDYSEFLTPERLAATEKEWAKMDRSKLIAAIMEHKPKSAIEFCCGTGWIPRDLPPDVEYIGIDANRGCIAYAQEKNPTRAFAVSDVRTYRWVYPHDMALAFSCLKHFDLAEWDGVYGKVLRAGRKTLTSIYMHKRDKMDAGHGFPHTAVTRERIESVIEANGHRLVKIFVLPPLNTLPEPLVLTEAVDGRADMASSQGLGI